MGLYIWFCDLAITNLCLIKQDVIELVRDAANGLTMVEATIVAYGDCTIAYITLESPLAAIETLHKLRALCASIPEEYRHTLPVRELLWSRKFSGRTPFRNAVSATDSVADMLAAVLSTASHSAAAAVAATHGVATHGAAAEAPETKGVAATAPEMSDEDARCWLADDELMEHTKRVAYYSAAFAIYGNNK